jgi:hypothetical protein
MLLSLFFIQRRQVHQYPSISTSVVDQLIDTITQESIDCAVEGSGARSLLRISYIRPFARSQNVDSTSLAPVAFPHAWSGLVWSGLVCRAFVLCPARHFPTAHSLSSIHSSRVPYAG